MHEPVCTFEEVSKFFWLITSKCSDDEDIPAGWIHQTDQQDMNGFIFRPAFLRGTSTYQIYYPQELREIADFIEAKNKELVQ